MSIDVFGYSLNLASVSTSRGPPGVGFQITSDGNYNIDQYK